MQGAVDAVEASLEPGTQTGMEAQVLPPVLSYSQIIDCILNDKPVPGIRHVPETILGYEASSLSRKVPRKKPWEA